MSASDWTGGYVADVNYTYGYYAELNPLRARLALLNQGYAPPRVQTACELGFGQGLSVGIHAAASGVEWWGTDFNPSQAAFAQEICRVSGADARLFDQAFAEFAARPDLPDFDFIGLHGIWSWISDQNREVLVDLIARRLRPGGLLYLSYNVHPGWTGFLPIRHLLTELARAGAGDTLTRIDEALTLADRLAGANPAYLRLHPHAAERLKKLRDQDRQYLAHEYFNRDWRPMHVSEAAELLARAKVTFAGSAHYLDHVDALNLTAEQMQVLGELKAPLLREQARDLIVNQQFRRDYWIKGPMRLTALEQAEALQAERVVLAVPREKVSLKVAGALGEGALSEAIYGPVLDLVSDHKPHTLGELAERLTPRGIPLAQVAEAAIVLSHNMQLAPAQDPAAVKAAKPRTDRLNAFLETRARSHPDSAYLASPVVGGGVGVGRFDQMFVAAVRGGAKTPADWARLSWAALAAQGQKIVKEGKALETPQENLAELEGQAAAFAAATLPVLRGLGVV